MISGRTKLVAHVGHPTEAFKAPLVYNPWFEHAGVDAVVVPMGVKAGDLAAIFRPLFRMSNILGALITMPHKVEVVGLLDEVSTAVKVAGSCNAVRLEADGRVTGDMFDGEGFVRGVLRKGRKLAGARALVVGAGGVGSAIAASLAGAGVATLALHDARAASAETLAGRLVAHHPDLEVLTGSNDPDGFDVVVNATPLGMAPGDPLPLDVDRVAPEALVGEVVMKEVHTPFLRAALARGCEVQVGTDMLFEMIPAYLEFFGLPVATPDQLRALARLDRA
jgi:shikimate dehydrogenase